MLKKIISLLLLIPISALATDHAGNSDSTLALFKPNPAGDKPLSISKYIDTQTYHRQSAFDFYLGISAEMRNASFDHEHKVTTPSEVTSTHSTLTANKMSESVLFGVGGRMGDFYIGPEFYALVGKVTKSVSSGAYHYSANLQNALGLDLLAGWYFKKSFRFYIRGGISRANMETDVSGPTVPLPPQSALGIRNHKETVTGLHLGVGFDWFINRFLSIRPEYNFTKYNGSIDTFDDPVVPNRSYRNSFAPKIHQIGIGLLLHFA